MARKSSSKKGRAGKGGAEHESILRQTHAAAAALNDAARTTRENEPPYEADLVTSEEDEYEIPPPVYGDIYGEIHDEKGGSGTSAYVAEDGRVNIRINQLNRRLSQLFTPALNQQVQSSQDSHPLPSPYVPPSLGGAEGVPPPPPMNIVIHVVGSRGDVQPFVALGKVLKSTYGHRVRLATHCNFKDFVLENGLEFFNIGGDPSALMAFMVKNPSLMPGFRSLLSGDVGQRRRDVAEYIQGCWRSCFEAGDGIRYDADDTPGKDSHSEPTSRPFVADCIIANPPSFAHIHCAEKLGIPLHIMFTMPYSPTQAYPHPLANVQSSNADPQLTNYLSYIMIEVLSWQGLGDIINRFRAKCLGLDPISMLWAPGVLQRLNVPHTYCWSPALIPKPKDWGPHISIAGFSFLHSSYTPDPDLQSFLDAGSPPVYIGFGSIVLDDPDAMTELIFEAARKTGQRVLLSKGWGGMGADALDVPDGVFILGNVPHDWLFRHVSCVVHHGGAGTTAAGIAAGRPTLVVPFFGDQPFWGAMVARAGAGPRPIPHKKLTADKLANAIDFCLKAESLERAKELGSKIAAERGSDMAAQSFHQHLELDRLRCTLAPSRAATWRIRRSQVKLSAFAACTLANANLLDFHDLKPFRPQEYRTDEGPLDPISGGGAACFRAFSGMVMGLAEVPTETMKTWKSPTASNRQQSKDSVATVTKTEEASPASSELNQASSSMQEPLRHVKSPSELSDTASLSPTIASSTISDPFQGQSDPKTNTKSRSRSRSHSRTPSSYSKDHDMMRRTGPHSSKGFGRFLTTAVQTPMEVTMGLTRGFHNMPKLWGDDTVRPQERVTDFKSGAVAAGKEFGFGFYDGVTGLITQPWHGAQKEGAIGVAKGIGKGLGGFAAKPFAGFSGLMGYTMKGVQKEVQKLFRGNVQNYIVASRMAQGYEEWLQSSEMEKEDVLVRWKLIQKYLKKKHNTDDMVRDVLEKQQQRKIEETLARGDYATSDFAQSSSADALTLDSGSAALSRGVLGSSRASRTSTEGSDRTGLSDKAFFRENAEVDARTERFTRKPVPMREVTRTPMPPLPPRRQETTDDQSDYESLWWGVAASEDEAQRHKSEELEFQKQLQQVMAQSMLEQKGNESEWQSGPSFRIEDEEELTQAMHEPGNISENVPSMVSGSGSIQRPSPYDPGHLGGTTQAEFEEQQRQQRGEKTAQEKTEEEIVLEYIKKQSLLEVYHQNMGKGKGRATPIEDKSHENGGQ
ncbi:hypothetical protein H2204_005869 [Knufia peltigerae]|uniref:Glycosyltransferase family 28 N-terminal domain-containing protein n=1 Tax=Knufia peltigerae TaxID=1002370 RepID=A0AA38Y550_9EURO|nr:hypothetical protein H2204_005869 [Knufia peltigerae]